MSKLTGPAFDPMDVKPRIGSGYPEEFQKGCETREKRRLGDHGGLVNFGVNLTTLPPGQGSAIRHWHTMQDEFVFVVSGELTLVTDAGEQILTSGMCAAFPKNIPDGHCLVNRSDAPASYLEIGDRTPGDVGHYPDVDLVADGKTGSYVFTRKDGTPY
ncbi:cupin domain-containing protein [Nisaea sp.]|uniref:cupin domain-containing protein n=1 Tax=Nisaea sp. TaxID=2024842 RepID=UPI0025FAD2A7|nr:cupin domain-containing protein [Nisaea sp.]